MYEEVAKNLAEELGITVDCASDVFYLRSRSRWTQELENKLIGLHKAGAPPNIYDFGCTRETGQALLKEALSQIEKNKQREDVEPSHE